MVKNSIFGYILVILNVTGLDECDIQNNGGWLKTVFLVIYWLY